MTQDRHILTHSLDYFSDPACPPEELTAEYHAMICVLANGRYKADCTLMEDILAYCHHLIAAILQNPNTPEHILQDGIAKGFLDAVAQNPIVPLLLLGHGGRWPTASGYLVTALFHRAYVKRQAESEEHAK